MYTRGSAKLTVSTTQSTIQGLNLRLDRAGLWIVIGVISLTVTGDTGQAFTVQLMQNGTVLQPVVSATAPTTATSIPVTQVWKVSANLNDSVQIQVAKAGGGGTSSIDGSNSTMTALWEGVQ